MLYPLSILTSEKNIFNEDVYSVNVPGAVGYFEVLAHHATVIALLQPGKLTIINKDHQKIYFGITTGFIEVSHNSATIIADAIESVQEIDVERAKQSYERAKMRLERADNHVDKERAKRSLNRAKNRIKLFLEIHPQVNYISLKALLI
ncbi:ATP synthase F1 subunit epsilon [Candidatus Protochlamydia amoebophila]|uniref:ATP synthase epsilon chain n=1 Tax=Candidatus Protochlamydia amoebophila TaxID=362787 RepID=A0A0C1JMF9_9BACT|nr:ATP synthase F1 subunit epsilon [Candidatus Protochlamydia amoebophila]KIC71751.1 ATP synthase epsilon chain [Candidatus Protochlamydia amoebophila]